MPHEQADALVHGAQGQTHLVVPAARWERRGVLGAGMIGACALGAAVGIMVRPDDVDETARMTAARAALPGPAETHLQIVVGPQPAPPLGPPLRIAASPEPVRVLSPAPPQAVVAPAPVAIAVREAEPAAAPKPPPVVVAKVETAEKPVAKSAPEVRAAPTRLAKAEAPRREKAEPKSGADKSGLSKTELANAERDKAAKARLAWLAKVERIKAHERGKAAKAELAKAEKAKAAKPVKLANAPPTPVKASTVLKAKAAAPKPGVPAKMAVQVAAARPVPRPAAVNAPASTLDIQLAALRAEPLKVSAPVQKTPASPPSQPPRACDADSRAEALVCGDPKLAAADRRLTAAYRRAVQAGASPDRLRRQQGRWLAARETAAEEAPWAVAQVYEARISELEGEVARAQAGD